MRRPDAYGHFNDQYKRFIHDIDAALSTITTRKQLLQSVQVPSKDSLYLHFASAYEVGLEAFHSYQTQVIDYLNCLAQALEEKRTRPFERLELLRYTTELRTPDEAAGQKIFEHLNDLIVQHNEQTATFSQMIANARKRLEQCLAAEVAAEFEQMKRAADNAESAARSILETVQKISEQITNLEKQIIEHLRPAAELNNELQSYLGRSELKFEVRDTGYAITRNGKPATNLSEGEKSAIAFLYFLKSLQDKAFNLKQDVVVIDDPVSSLDANALFSAFGYMKERAKDAGQLFVLTHNFAFFRLVKNWFSHLPGQNKKDSTQHSARFLMLEAYTNAGQRRSALAPLDPLLHQFESDYHYLFKKVHDETSRPAIPGELERYYMMPNIARRLLESFLAFRLPSQSGELKQKLDKLSFDSAKKTRILRFLHTYSHDGKISEPEHDLSILSETPQVLVEVMELINEEDPKHFQEMMQLISPP